MNEKHLEDRERLWEALEGDLSPAILEMAGHPDEGGAVNRLVETWDKLCDLDLDLAASLYHGVEEIYMMMGKSGAPNSPADHRVRRMDEIVGLIKIAREKHPDAKTKTVGELVDLAEDTIRGEIDDETEGRGEDQS